MIDLGALDVWAQWLVVGVGVWVVAGTVGALVIGRVVRARERQVPREQVEAVEEEDPAPVV